MARGKLTLYKTALTILVKLETVSYCATYNGTALKNAKHLYLDFTNALK